MDSWHGGEEEEMASVAGSDEGWASPGSLDELVTAVSDLPPSSALATVAASRPPRGASVFMTPLPQPDWEQAGGGSGWEEEGVASSSAASS